MHSRIGFGVDFHQLAEGRDLWLGDIKIPSVKGSLGHSDADVLLHAVCDAMLGAACLGDIGVHFPDTSAAFKNIDSKLLLQNCVTLLEEARYKIINIDTTVCLEYPKIREYIPQMQQTIAGIAGITEKDVSIKATTTEKMGFVGRGEGLIAYAIVLIEKI